MIDAAGSIGDKMGFARSSLLGDSFHNESSVSLNSKSGIPGGDSELCPAYHVALPGVPKKVHNFA